MALNLLCLRCTYNYILVSSIETPYLQHYPHPTMAPYPYLCILRTNHTMGFVLRLRRLSELGTIIKISSCALLWCSGTHHKRFLLKNTIHFDGDDVPKRDWRLDKMHLFRNKWMMNGIWCDEDEDVPEHYKFEMLRCICSIRNIWMGSDMMNLFRNR
jgi:hypothetical protein